MNCHRLKSLIPPLNKWETCTHSLEVHDVGLALRKMTTLLRSKFLTLLFSIESLVNPLNLSCPMLLLK